MQGPMLQSAFSHVRAWVFDLDNTLYPPTDRLFDQIEVKMRDFVMDAVGVDAVEADRLRVQYWQTYGTSLAGLMHEHGVPPWPFLHDVHQIDLSHMTKDMALAAMIKDLPGRKIVYTNGTEPYAQNVLKARGLDGLFDAIYGVEHANYVPKPRAEAFEQIFATDGIDTQNAAMFEDELRNLEVPHAMGMRTIHVAETRQDAPYLHHHTHDLTAFLQELTG